MSGEGPAAGGQGRLAAGGRPLAAFLLYAALVVPAMFSRDLWDPDEPRFAQIGREMLRTGDWVLPRMNGEPLALLPPLYDWVSAASGAPAGDVTPAAARAGAALGGLLALLSAWFLARRWWGDAAAGWSALVLATAAMFWWQSSYAQVDMLLVGLVTASMAAFRVSWEMEDRGLPWFLAGCALAALGTLAKGPVAAVLPGIVFLALALAERRRGFLRPAWLAAGLGAYLAVAAPWYAIACDRGGPDFARELLLKHNFGMFFETWSHRQPPWYYLQNFPWAFAPWIVFLPAAALASREALRAAAPSTARALFRPATPDAEAGRHRFLWIWFLALFVFFSVSQAKQTKYVLPAMPAAAILVGWRLAQPKKLPVAALAVLAAVGILALGAAAAAAGGIAVPAKYGDEAAMLARPALVALLGLGGWIAAPLARGRARELVAGGFGCSLLALALLVFPRVDRLKSARPLCDRVRAAVPAGTETGIYGIQERKIGAFRYYLDRPLATFEDPRERADPRALADWWSRPGPRCLFADDADPLPESVAATARRLDGEDVGHRRIVVYTRP